MIRRVGGKKNKNPKAAGLRIFLVCFWPLYPIFQSKYKINNSNYEQYILQAGNSPDLEFPSLSLLTAILIDLI